MPEFNNPLELYKLLNKSNCKQCMLPSCFAFSVAVIQGEKTLQDCPHIRVENKNNMPLKAPGMQASDDDPGQALQKYRDEISKLDLKNAAARLNVPVRKEKVVINCLGKDFMVDSNGNLNTECHKNLWVHAPILKYILHSRGIYPKGNWVSFAELKGAEDWNRFFSHRCELDLHKLADAHSEIFFEILGLFCAETTQGVTNADRSLVIYPLPNVPFLINYWEPEESFDSKLNILFDVTATDNIDIESIYVLSRGLVEMFRVLIAKHSKDGKIF